MRLWAPVAEVDVNDDCLDEIVIDRKVAKWMRGGLLYSQYTLEMQVDHSCFATFEGDLTLVVVCAESMQTFSRKGRVCQMSLPFKPVQICPCRKGLVLLASSGLYLVTDPMASLSMVGMSSNSELDLHSKILAFGSETSSFAVLYNATTGFVNLYDISYVEITTKSKCSTCEKSQIFKRQSSGRAIATPLKTRSSSHGKSFSSRLNDDSSMMDFQDLELLGVPKEVILEQVATLSVGKQKEFQLQTVAQEMAGQQVVYVLDRTSKQLHVGMFSGETRKFVWKNALPALAMVAIKGFQIGSLKFPFVVLLNTENVLQLWSGFFQLACLDIPYGVTGDSIINLKKSNENTFLTITQSGANHRLALVAASTEGLVESCFVVLEAVCGKESLAYWIFAFDSAYYFMDSEWDAFSVACYAALIRFPDEDSPCEIGSFEWNLAAAIQQHFGKPDVQSGDVILGLHLLKEEYELSAHGAKDANLLSELLLKLTRLAEWRTWEVAYQNGSEIQKKLPVEATKIIAEPPPFAAPNIYQTLVASLLHFEDNFYPTLPSCPALYKTRICGELFTEICNPHSSPKAIVQLLASMDLTPKRLNLFSEMVRVPIMEIICYLQTQTEVQHFGLLKRYDLATTPGELRLEQQPWKAKSTISGVSSSGVGTGVDSMTMKMLSKHMAVKDQYRLEDPVEQERIELARLIFREDRRFYEVVKLLQTSQIQISSIPRTVGPEGQSRVFLQQSVARVIAIRTLSTAFGRAALYCSSKVPLISERLLMPPIEFDVFVRELNITIGCANDQIPEAELTWGYFNHGVAVGLSVSRHAKNIDGSWVVYNRPDPQSSKSSTELIEHSGLILGLGLSGQLKKFEEWHIYNYLGPQDAIMSTAILIGLGASNRGSMDSKLTKVLSVHIGAMLPNGSSDLNVTPEVEQAAIIGLGLLYCETSHRRMTEMLLVQLKNLKTPKPEMYRTACGIALGLINLNKGINSQALMDQLLALTQSQYDSTTQQNLQLSAVGVNIALALMFGQSNNEAVASKLRPPHSLEAAEYVRPDQLFTRALAQNHILNDRIQPTRTWVEDSIPEKLKLPQNNLRLSSDHLPYFNVLGGTLVALALKYTASNDSLAMETLLYYVNWMYQLSKSYRASNFDSRLTFNALTKILARVALAASAVAVGGGNVELLRLLRMLWSPNLFAADYDVFSCASLAMGLLFLGGGSFSLDPSPRGTGMLCLSFMSLLSGPPTPWMLIRHFWVFAAEPRLMVTRSVTNNMPVLVNTEVRTSDGKIMACKAPHLLPSLNTLNSIKICDKHYLPFEIRFTDSDSPLATEFLRTLTIYVQPAASSEKLKCNIGELLSVDRDMGPRQPGIRSPALTLKILEHLSQSPNVRSSVLWGLRFLFNFLDKWRPEEELAFIPRCEIDKLKVNVWRAREVESGASFAS